MSNIIHNPKHKYDCGNCKMSWCCGYVCACGLRRLPEPTDSIKNEVKKQQKEWRVSKGYDF